jgi:DNA polymerase V
VAGIHSIYQPGHQLVKAGVMLLYRVSSRDCQGELDLEPGGGHGREALMASMDAINHRYGRDTLHLASSGIDDHRRLWGMRQARLTPGYTTDWVGKPIAKAV